MVFSEMAYRTQSIFLRNMSSTFYLKAIGNHKNNNERQRSQSACVPVHDALSAESPNPGGQATFERNQIQPIKTKRDHLLA